jgi:imidazole glycerol-phosphate synthase subunit HisH
MMTIVDYGLGNVRAFTNVFKRLNLPSCVAQTEDDLLGASRLILPGVGAFDHAMEQLHRSGLRQTLDELVRVRNVPVLGVCVGMQMLADGSEEGQLPGLGWVPGQVRRFSSNAASTRLPMPHMGWNDVRPKAACSLFAGLESDARFYFLHSFYFDCAQSSHAAAEASYGFDFTCAVRSAHVHGVQFHPEKSHHWGERLLGNFALGKDPC